MSSAYFAQFLLHSPLTLLLAQALHADMVCGKTALLRALLQLPALAAPCRGDGSLSPCSRKIWKPVLLCSAARTGCFVAMLALTRCTLLHWFFH